jgi:long-chain acyl-CoA synthetase
MRELPALRHEVLYGNRIVPCFAERPETIDAMFRTAVVANTDRNALVEGDTRVSYAALEGMVNCAAQSLIRRGFVKGERIALLMGNEIEFVVAFLAAARIGMISVPMNIRQRPPEVLFVLNQCGTAAVIVDEEHAVNLPAAVDALTIRATFVVGDASSVPGSLPFETLLQPGDPVDLPNVAQEDTLCLLYTSGTTGKPKGAMLTNVSVIHSLIHYAWSFELRQGDVAFLSVPASHVTGIIAILLTTMYVGGTTVIIRAFKARSFLELAAAERINYSLMVPAMYNLCLLAPEFLSFDLSTWRIAGFGGAPMPQATIELLADQLPNLSLCNVYGSTETSSPVTILPIGMINGHADTVGKVLPLADILVVDDQGCEVAPGESGELLIGGPMVVPSYWDNPEGNAKGFIMGYWVSGDIGSKDAEGYIRVFDRKKDMINRGGFKVYCIEVENTMMHHPAVVEVAVVGRPDPVLGELVHAFVWNDGRLVTEVEIKCFCSERLSDYKVPHAITILSAPLPRNAAGKVLKNVLRELLTS